MAQGSSAPVWKGREVGSLEVIPKAALRGEKICQNTRPCLCWLCAPVPGCLVLLGYCTDDRPLQLLSALTTIAYSSLILVEGGIELGRFRVFWRCEGR